MYWFMYYVQLIIQLINLIIIMIIIIIITSGGPFWHGKHQSTSSPASRRNHGRPRRTRCGSQKYNS